MIDTCTITRPGAATFDSGDGSYTPTASSTIYAGPCLVTLSTARGEMEEVVGDLNDQLRRYSVLLPASATGIAREDIFTVTETDDPDLIDRTLVVSDVPAHSWNVDQQIVVEDRTEA